MPLVKPVLGSSGWGPVLNTGLDYLDTQTVAETAARAAADTAHAAAADPHAVYLTTAEADAAYSATGHSHSASAFRGARAFHSAAQSLVNDTPTAIALAGENFDTNALHDVTTNNSRVVLNAIGYWIVSGAVGYTANPTGRRSAIVNVNGVPHSQVTLPATAANSIIVPVTAIVQATAITDYVELFANQDSGGALNTTAAATNTYLSVAYVGA